MNELWLIPPGESPGDVLFPHFETAMRDGRRVWFLVPGVRQRRARIRQLAQRLPLLDPPVGTLDDLAALAHRRAGRPVPPRPEPLLMDLLLRDALRVTWPTLATGPGLESAARRALGSLMEDDWEPESFGSVLERIADPYPRGARIRDLWNAVHRLCEEADTAAPLREVLRDGLLRDEPPQLLLIEGGRAPGELRARLLEQLIRAVRSSGGDVVATVFDGPDGRGGYARGRSLLQALLRTEARPAPQRSTRPAALEHLARELFRAGTECESADGVYRLTAPDAASTADLVAREILALLRGAEVPERLLGEGVVVVCPTTEDREAAEHALRAHNLPVAWTPREPISAHPGGRFLILLLDFLARGQETPLEVVIELLASDGWGAAPLETDRIARDLHIGGAVTAGDAERRLATLAGRTASRTRQRLERLFRLGQAFARTRSSAERSALIRGLIRRGWARDREHWIVDPRRGSWYRHGSSGLAAGHTLTPAVRAAAGYARPLRRLDDLLLALDEQEQRTHNSSSPAEWLRSLREMLGEIQLQIGSEPALGVRLEAPGAIEPAAVVFVLGLVERRFPRSPRQDAFLPDSLRSALAEGFLLPPRLSSDGPDAERERFVLACAAARRRLYLCHPRTDGDGHEVLPSFFVEDVALCLGLSGPDALPQRRRRIGDVVPDAADCTSPAEFRARLAMALHDPELPESDRLELCRAIDQEVARDEWLRHTLLDRFSDWEAKVDEPAHRRHLAASAERLSASQLGAYAHCGFRHFVERRLEPVAIQLPVFDPARRGSAIHDLLWQFGAQWGGWTDPEPALERIRSFELTDSEPSVLGSPRSRAEWLRWRERLCEFLENEHARLLAGRFRPEFHELTFGEREGQKDPWSRDEPVELRFGTGTIRFSGSIDRIDTCEVGGAVHGVAIDYKTGKVNRHRKAIESGDELQLLLYLRVLEAYGIRPAAALYLSVANDEVAGVVHEGFADEIGPHGRNVIVVADHEWTELRRRADERIVELYRNMKQPVIVARPRDWKCWPCELQAFCRIHLWRARRHA